MWLLQLGRFCLLGFEPRPEQLPIEPSPGSCQTGTGPCPLELTIQRTDIVVLCHTWVRQCSPLKGPWGPQLTCPLLKAKYIEGLGKGWGGSQSARR